MAKRLNTSKVIESFINTHGDLYDYSKVTFKNTRTKVEITCKKHGSFLQRVTDHRKGQGCPKCRCGKKSNLEIIKGFKLIHGSTYDYSKVNYIKAKVKVEIICKKHGSFFQTTGNHNLGKGCGYCANNKKLTNDKAILGFQDIHGDLYDYSKVKYRNAYTKVEIICREHGTFLQKPNDHKNGNGCPKCYTSKGENKIRKYLVINGFHFVEQKRFTDCKNNRPLPFDFYIKKLNLVIEFNGLQHYKPIKFFGGFKKFSSQVINDRIKSDYCKSAGLRLLVISYKDIDNIKGILDSELINNR